jgi:hypothetical protein
MPEFPAPAMGFYVKQFRQRSRCEQTEQRVFGGFFALAERILPALRNKKGSGWFSPKHPNRERAPMCDYSLSNVRSRPAQVGDKLTTRDFGTGTRGFSAAEDASLAVCILPGTELSFAEDVRCVSTGLLPWRAKAIDHRTAIFRQVNKGRLAAHHDALEFPDGRTMLLTLLCEGQRATVLQLPVQPKTAEEAASRQRTAYAG